MEHYIKWIWRLWQSIRKKASTVYEASEAATESPVYIYKNPRSFGQEFTEVNIVVHNLQNILALPLMMKREEGP